MDILLSIWLSCFYLLLGLCAFEASENASFIRVL